MGRYQSLTLEQLQKIIIDKGYKMPENSKNKRYLIRAIQKEGVPTKRKGLVPDSLIVGLFPEKEILQARIKKRIDFMINNGVVEEYKNIINRYGDNPATRSGIYGVIKANNELEEIKKNAYFADWHLVRKQVTWFKRNSDIVKFKTSTEAFAWLDEYIGGKLE